MTIVKIYEEKIANKFDATLIQENAYKIVDAVSQLGLIENYFSCLALTGTDEKIHWAIIHSLLNENGLVNVMDSLSIVRTKLQKIADSHCDFGE